MKAGKARVFVGVVAACLVLGLAVSGMAQEKKTSPCAADIKKFCASVNPGEGRIAACVDQHKNELSPGCKSHVDEVTAQGYKGACHDDILNLCPTAKPGKGKIIACLGDQERKGMGPYGKLSAGCAKWLADRNKEAGGK